MSQTIRIAQLTDIHLPPPGGIRLRDLLTKRITGFANWHRNRKRRHLRSIVDKLVLDMHEQGTNHVCVTGDLVNLGLPTEFDAALDWLHTVGEPDAVSVIPGNHDTYVALPIRSCFDAWQSYMQGNTSFEFSSEPDFATHAGVAFPYVNLVGDAAIINLSSAIPTKWFSAEGNLGNQQCELLPQILEDLKLQGKFRIVTIHHPPLIELATRRKGLRDAPRLKKILQDHGAELLLYGHNHIQRVDWLKTCDGSIPLVCTPSLSAASPHHPPLGRYNLFEIQRTETGWACHMTGRGVNEPSGSVENIGSEDLSPKPI